jgi:DNA mismatch endonuclease (patch repair protein)
MAVKSYLRALKKELNKQDIKFEQNKTIAGIKVPISFPASKVLVMIDECSDGCGCPEHYQQPENEDSPWGPGPTHCTARIERENHRLGEVGWKVLRFWEHDVDRSPESVAEQIFMELGMSR